MSSIAFGWVRMRRSLLPRRSRWKSLKRSPRKAASSYSSAWIMVPIAPSSTRMRSRASASKAVRLGETGTVIGSGGFLRAGGANAEQMADREHQVGAVHGVEMERVDAVLGELLQDRKSTRLNSSHANISYAVFCLKKKKQESQVPPADSQARVLRDAASRLAVYRLRPVGRRHFSDPADDLEGERHHRLAQVRPDAR